LRFVNFKWAQLDPLKLDWHSLLLIRGLQQQSLVPSTHLFGSGAKILGSHLTPIGAIDV